MLNWSPHVSSSLHKPSLGFRRGCRFPRVGKEQKGRRGEERLCWPCCSWESSRFVLRGQLSSPLFSYILAATFFTPLRELLPDHLCERETCLSWCCICSRLFPGCCCSLADTPGGTPRLVRGWGVSRDCTPTGDNGRARDHRSSGREMGPVVDPGRTDGSAPTRSRGSGRCAPCPTSLKSAFELPLVIFNKRLDKYLPKK